MIDQLAIINELGPDADLLLESDDYLENQRKQLATELSKLSVEFDKVLRAQKFKARLQHTNSVAVKVIERDDYGRVTDISLKIMPMPDAIKTLKNGAECGEDQYAIWRTDGYDLQSSEALRAV